MSSFINFNNRANYTDAKYSAEAIKIALLKSETKSSTKAEALVKNIKEPIVLNEALALFNDKLTGMKSLTNAVVEINEGRVKQFEMDYKDMESNIKKGYGWIDPEYVEDTWENTSDSIDFELIKDEILSRLIKAGLLWTSKDGESKDKKIKSIKDIKELVAEALIEEARSINKIQKEYGEVVNDMTKTVTDWKTAEGDVKTQLLEKLRALTARKKELEAELDSAVIGKDRDVELSGAFEAVVTENYEVIYSDGVSALKKFRSESQALDFMKKEIASNKKLRDIAVYKPGMHSTTQTELVVKFWGKGSYLDNVSKKDPELAAKKLEESVVTEAYTEDDINIRFGFYGTIKTLFGEKTAKKLHDEGIKDLQKKYKLSEKEALLILNFQLGEKAAELIENGVADSAIEGLEQFYGKRLKRVIKKEIEYVFGESIDYKYYKGLNVAGVNEAKPAGLSKEETLKVAQKFADALTKLDGKKYTVSSDYEEDSFDLDFDGEEYAGGSYNINADGSVVNMAVWNKSNVSPTYGNMDDDIKTIIKTIKNIKESVVTEAKFVKDFDEAVLKATTKEEILEVYPNAKFFVGKLTHFFGELDNNLFFRANYAGKKDESFKVKSVYSKKGSNYVHLFNELGESVVTERSRGYSESDDALILIQQALKGMKNMKAEIKGDTVIISNKAKDEFTYSLNDGGDVQEFIDELEESVVTEALDENKPYFDFLVALRDSGATNMFGAAPYLQDAFDLSKSEAKRILVEWMKSFNESLVNEKFFRMSKETIEKELYAANLALTTYYDWLKAGNDSGRGESLDHIMNLLKKCKDDIKKFNKKEEVEGTVYEAQKQLTIKDIEKAWDSVYGEDFEYEYAGVYGEIKRKYKGKITKAELHVLWYNRYGEQLQDEYSGFLDKLDENLNEATVVMDAMDPKAKSLKKLLKKYNVTMKVINKSGPGGGWPEVEMKGSVKDLTAVLADPTGWDDADLAEYIEEAATTVYESVVENRMLRKGQFRFGAKLQYGIEDVNESYGFYGTLIDQFGLDEVNELFLDGFSLLGTQYDFTDQAALYYLNSKAGRWVADQVTEKLVGAKNMSPYYGHLEEIFAEYAKKGQWKKWSKEYDQFAEEDNIEEAVATVYEAEETPSWGNLINNINHKLNEDLRRDLKKYISENEDELNKLADEDAFETIYNNIRSEFDIVEGTKEDRDMIETFQFVF